MIFFSYAAVHVKNFADLVFFVRRRENKNKNNQKWVFSSIRTFMKGLFKKTGLS